MKKAFLLPVIYFLVTGFNFSSGEKEKNISYLVKQEIKNLKKEGFTIACSGSLETTFTDFYKAKNTCNAMIGTGISKSKHEALFNAKIDIANIVADIIKSSLRQIEYTISSHEEKIINEALIKSESNTKAVSLAPAFITNACVHSKDGRYKYYLLYDKKTAVKIGIDAVKIGIDAVKERASEGSDFEHAILKIKNDTLLPK